MRTVFAFAPMILAVSLIFQGCQRTDGPVSGDVLDEPAVAVGRRAPDIVGVDQNGDSFRLSDYRGQVVVLNFWADW